MVQDRVKKVFDVVCSDGLEVDPTTHRCPDNGARVNIEDCSITDNVGATELKATWKDPEFNPQDKAFLLRQGFRKPNLSMVYMGCYKGRRQTKI